MSQIASPVPHTAPLLPALLVSDAVAGVLAGSVCAPLVAIIDEAITLSAAGKKELWSAIGGKLFRITKAPVRFLRSASFLWLWAVYAVTYATANAADSFARAVGHDPATPVLLCSTAANMGMCLLKDKAFAEMFGSADDKTNKTAGLSPQVLALWFWRDIITQFFVFTMPALLAGHAPDLAVRLSAPVVAQYFTSPLHLLGMKLFSAPIGTSIASQWAGVWKILASTIVARQMRIFPAFSVGGVVNKALRHQSKL